MQNPSFRTVSAFPLNITARGNKSLYLLLLKQKVKNERIWSPVVLHKGNIGTVVLTYNAIKSNQTDKFDWTIYTKLLHSIIRLLKTC